MTDGAREKRLGCGAYFAIGIVAMVVSGFLAAQIGRFIQPHVNDDILTGRLAFIAGIDAVAIVAILYSRAVEGAAASRERLRPILVSVQFIALGLMCGHGHGLVWLFFWGGLNGAIGLSTWFILLRKRNPTEATQQ